MNKIINKTFTNDGLYLYRPTELINCKFCKIEGRDPDHHGAEVYGTGKLSTEPTYIFRNCVFDNEGIPADHYDEGVALVDAPNVLFERCRFTHLGKAVLVGNGDYADEVEENLRVIFHECIFEDNGRRNPYIQFGEAVISNCLIKNWGHPDYFYLKSHGLRVGKSARCTVSGSIFIQENFYPGWKNFISDITNQYSPILIPGNFRGAYAEPGGVLNLNHCYRNSKMVWFSAENQNPMSEEEAEEKIKYLETVVPRL